MKQLRKKMNKSEFITFCKSKRNWNFRKILNDKRITWDKSKLKIAKELDKPFDYYEAIKVFKDG